MLVEVLWQTYPRLYHMAADGSWPSIQRHGLLSTVALLDLFEIDGSAREQIDGAHRPKSVRISHAKHGAAEIRDQKPMSDSALRKCLDGISPRDWYQFLNRRVFFWPTEERLHGLLRARPYRKNEHCVLTIDTKSLLNAHSEAVTLSPINSGSTLYNPQSRGYGTFQSIADYPFEDRRRQRGRDKAVAEIAINYSVPDIRRHVLVVERRRGVNLIETLWRK